MEKLKYGNKMKTAETSNSKLISYAVMTGLETFHGAIILEALSI